MLRHTLRLTLCLSLICCVLRASAQQPAASGIVPPAVKFGCIELDVNSKPLSPVLLGLLSRFTRIKRAARRSGWKPKTSSRTRLGTTRSRWVPLLVMDYQPVLSPPAKPAGWEYKRRDKQSRRARCLMSVPYALKALDAETIGGKPLSALQLAAPNGGSSSASSARIKRPWPIPSRVLPGRGARRISFLCLIATAEQRQSEIRLSRKAARPLVLPAAQGSRDRITAVATSSSAAVVGNDNSGGAQAGVVLVPAQTALECGYRHHRAVG